LRVRWAARKGAGDKARHADRFLPIPESGTLAEMACKQGAAAIVGRKTPGEALKDRRAQATRIMAKSGYHTN
jgi:hypothetical protein